MEIVKDIAAILGLLMTIFSFFSFTTEKGRKFIAKLIKANTHDLQATNQQQSKDIEDIKNTLILLSDKISVLSNEYADVKEMMIQQCRDIIKNIYYKYRESKLIPLYERKTADKTYVVYHDRLGGNSYVHLLYDEIKKWEIDTVDHPILDEDE